MNRASHALAVQHPILQGGMGNISDPKLAAAISNAGALGTIGAGTMSAPLVERKIIEVKKLTNHPFAVNIALSVSPYANELIEMVKKHHVPVVILSAGNPGKYVGDLHNAGVKVCAVVGSVKHARKAAAAGVDLIIGEGYEAAGLNSPYETTTLTLIPQLVDAVALPVVAAGGICDGRGMAAMFALGAEGIQMGTRFIATKEASFSRLYKQRLIEARDEGTVIIGRSVNRIRRVLKNTYSDTILEKEGNGLTLEEYNTLTNETRHMLGAVTGDEQHGYWNCGQIAGAINDEPSVQELISQMTTDYQTVIEKMIGINNG